MYLFPEQLVGEAEKVLNWSISSYCVSVGNGGGPYRWHQGEPFGKFT